MTTMRSAFAACMFLLLHTASAYRGFYVEPSQHHAANTLSMARRHFELAQEMHRSLHPPGGFPYPFQRMNAFRFQPEELIPTPPEKAETLGFDAHPQAPQTLPKEESKRHGGTTPAQSRQASRSIPITTVTRTPGDDAVVRYATEATWQPRHRPSPPPTASTQAAENTKVRRGQPFEVEVRDVVPEEPRPSASLPDIEGCIESGFCTFSKDGTVKFGPDTYACAPAGDGIKGKAPSLADCAVWYRI